MSRFLCVALLASLAVMASAEISFDTCASTGTTTSVTITDCERDEVCQFVKGEKYEVTVTFAPGHDLETLDYAITGSLGIITIPIQKGNACLTMTEGCPAASGLLTTFKTELEITDQYIETEATVKITMTDDKSRIVVCVTTDAEIVSARKHKTLRRH